MTLQIDMINATITAIPNEAKWKVLPTTKDVNSNIIPFRIILNNPKVTKLIGKDKINNTGFTNAFRIAKTIAATIAVSKEAT